MIEQLNNEKIISAAVSDNHSLFLSEKYDFVRDRFMTEWIQDRE